MKKNLVRDWSLVLVPVLALTACEPSLELDSSAQRGQSGADQTTSRRQGPINVKQHSVTPPLVKTMPGFEGVRTFGIIGSDDVLEETPSFRFGGSADGAGLLKTRNGYALVVNHEDNFAVSRVSLNNNLKPVAGEYILNSDGGKWRLCSASLATPEEHGFGPVFLTCGESGEESRTHALDPYSPASSAAVSRELAGLGRWSAENAVPLPKIAYPGRTVVLIGDDDSDQHGGQLAMYVSSTGDLENGELYVMRRTDLNTREMDIVEGTPVPVEFIRIDGHKLLTGAQINSQATAVHSLAFGRVEDIDYRKNAASSGREVYFNVTGQNNTGTNAGYSRSKYGRVYKLVLDPADPRRGSLEVVLDGDRRGASDKAREFQNPDNILVTENYAYIQEDPNSNYNDQTHDAYVYQYNLSTGQLKVVFELDHRRTAPDAAKYNASPGSGYPTPVAGTSGYGSWEYGAMLDVSRTTGQENTFLLCIQPHSWRGSLYAGVDGGSLRMRENQASQVILIQGLPR